MLARDLVRMPFLEGAIVSHPRYFLMNLLITVAIIDMISILEYRLKMQS
jgi:hypothetical protein